MLGGSASGIRCKTTRHSKRTAPKGTRAQLPWLMRAILVNFQHSHLVELPRLWVRKNRVKRCEGERRAWRDFTTFVKWENMGMCVCEREKTCASQKRTFFTENFPIAFMWVQQNFLRVKSDDPFVFTIIFVEHVLERFIVQFFLLWSSRYSADIFLEIVRFFYKNLPALSEVI